MIFIKITGVIFIILSSSFYGFYRAQKIKFHINDLYQISNALEILDSEIKFGVTPLDEAVKNICERSKFFVKEFFLDINRLLKDKKKSASEIWLESTDNIYKNHKKYNKNFLDIEDILLINLFSNVISNPDPELQTKYISKINIGLQKKILILEKKYQNEKKLSYNLGFLFGLLIITIFI